MDIEIWHIWFISTILLFILEIFLPTFVAACIGLGTLVAGIMAYFGLGLEAQLLGFSVATLVSLFLIRPAMLKVAKRRSTQVSTNMDALIGRTGVVSEKIEPWSQTGRVIIDGDSWKAKSLQSNAIEKDTIVTVTKIESIILTVKPLND